MKAIRSVFVLATALSAYAQLPGQMAPPKPTTTKPVDLHTSQNSLDWAGTYEGVGPCADCPGIKTRLTLNRDGTYELTTQYLGRQVAPETVRGRFTWQPSGNAITLDARGGAQQYSVGEGRLSLLNHGGGTPVVLTLVAQATAGDNLSRTFELHRWTLESATDSHNRPIAMLPPDKDHPVVLNFSGNNRLNIQGPCNRIIGAYQINASRQLIVRGAGSTMMACDPALMRADTALSGILAQPLNVTIDNAPSPRLQLRSVSNGTLTFVGQATPEALYGPGTIMFFEISPQHIACEHPPAPQTNCLQVRERRFDEQGLPAGAPGEWRPLYENIEGFTHEEGMRNVVRVKRFERNPAPAGSSPTLYVLDLIVETELVNPPK
jgi:heat shock protein HslJ